MFMFFQPMHTLMLEILKSGTGWWIVLGLSWVLIFEGKMVHFHCFTRCTRCREIILPQKMKNYLFFIGKSGPDIFVILQTELEICTLMCNFWLFYFEWFLEHQNGATWPFILFTCTFMSRAEYTYSHPYFQRFPYHCSQALSQKK